MKMKMKIIKTLANVAVIAITSNSAWAAGTAAGTGVDNIATISYQVSGIDQTPIGSSVGGNTSGAGTPTSFIVDKKVDVDVTANGSAVAPALNTQNITPSGSATHTFIVTNEGNDIEFFDLAELNATTGDEFDVNASCTITVTAVTGATDTIPVSALVPTAISPISSTASPLRLAPDGTAAVSMECTAPASTGVAPLVNGDDANVSLVATATITDGGAALTDTGGLDDFDGKDTVLADAAGTADGDTANDASHSATVEYNINTATLTVTKESAVIDDFISTAPNFKRIPGALIRYTITVTNTAAEPATDIIISDSVDPSLTFQACSMTLNGTPVVGGGCPTPAVPAVGAPTLVASDSFGLADGSTTTQTAILTIDALIK